MNGKALDTDAPERHLSTLRAGIPLVAISTVVVAILAVALSLAQTSLYKASTQVFISTGIGVTLPGVAASATSSDPDRVLTTQAQVARVPHVAAIALKEAKVSGISPKE